MKLEKEFPLKLILLMPLLMGIGLSFSVIPQRLRSEILAVQQADQNQDPAGIADHLGNVLDWEPWRTNQWEIAGKEALAAGNYTQAINFFRTAASLQSLSNEGHIELGDAYLDAGDWRQAVSTWQGLAVNGKIEEALWQKILDQQWQHQAFADGLHTALAWLGDFPQSPQAAFKAGLLECLGDPPSAPPLLDQASKLDPGLTSEVSTLEAAINTAYLDQHEGYRRVVIGRALASLGEWDLAKRSFEIATSATPDYAEGWAFLGEAKQQLGEDGSQNLKHAAELDPNSLLVKALLALWNRDTGHPEVAMTLLQQVAALEPTQAVWQMELGNTAASMGDLYAALGYYQQATNLEPGNAQTWLALGDFSVVHLLQPREIGLPAARQALLLTSSSAPALDLMGCVMLALDDADSAERFLQQAIEKDSASAAARLHLAQLYLSQNQMNAAYRLLNEAVKLAGKDSQTELLANRLLARYFGGQ
jgi:tetratricopeptide (TPR) repeat protein